MGLPKVAHIVSMRLSDGTCACGQVLTGHTGPVSSLCFSPVQSILASASWDKTVRIWDMIDSWQTKETLPLPADGTLHPPPDRYCHTWFRSILDGIQLFKIDFRLL